MKPYFKFAKRPNKTTDRQKLIGKVDALLSECVRLRDSNESGYAVCVTCQETYHWTEMQCGHYIPRGNMATRYDLRNVNSQCGLCNSTHDGKAETHGCVIDEIHGPGTAEQLEKLGRTERHFSEPELKSMCEELRKEIKSLKEEKFR